MQLDLLDPLRPGEIRKRPAQDDVEFLSAIMEEAGLGSVHERFHDAPDLGYRQAEIRRLLAVHVHLKLGVPEVETRVHEPYAAEPARAGAHVRGDSLNLTQAVSRDVDL